VLKSVKAAGHGLGLFSAVKISVAKLSSITPKHLRPWARRASGYASPRPLTRQLRSADMTRYTGKEQERRRRRPRRRAGRRWLERLSRHPQGEREAPALLRHPAPAPRGGEECLLGGSQTRAPQQLQVLRFQRVRLTCRGVANCLLTLIATQSRPHRQGPPSDQIYPRDC
jgi:hypothetical protein